MKKIGIITICRCNNYGAELQAFALQRKLTLIGYDAEVIDYLFYKHPKHLKECASLPDYKGYPWDKVIREILLPWIEKCKSLKHRAAIKSREENFKLFHKKNTRFSMQYRRYSELYKNPPVYDAYCVGSDQVWNPWNFTSLNSYFLTFEPEGAVKLSYASSFGVSEIPVIARNFFHSGLNNLNHISVREKTGVSIVKGLVGRDAKHVADPTLLLTADEWENVLSEKKVPKGKYILLYVLKDSPYITETALRVAKEKELKIVRICKGAFRQDSVDSKIINIMDAGPAEFLGLFKSAEMVLTNSFHGTVFSILFNKDFYTIVDRSVNNNSRQIDLLATLGIGRIKYSDEVFDEVKSLDWVTINKNVAEFRQSSIDYLEKAINNEK